MNKTQSSVFCVDLVEFVHQHQTQQATQNNMFLTQENTLQYGLVLVGCFGAKCWNDIPINIKISPSKKFSFENSKPFSLKVNILPDLNLSDTKD